MGRDMLTTLEYRRVARTVMRDMGLRCRGTWTDDPLGRGWTSSTCDKRTVTLSVLDSDNLFGAFVLPEFVDRLRKELALTYSKGRSTINRLRVTTGGYIKTECTLRGKHDNE